MIGGLGLVIFGCALWIGRIAFFTGYNNVTLPKLFEEIHPDSVTRFLFSDRTGMVWFEPWWVLSLLVGLLRLRRASWVARGATAWLLMEAAVGTAWNGNGGDFGYRYLIGSYAGALAIWLDALNDAWALKAFVPLATVGAAWSTFLIFMYKTAPGAIPEIIPIRDCSFGISMGVPNFAWTTIQGITNPVTYAMAARFNFPLITAALNTFPDNRWFIPAMRLPPEALLSLSVAVLLSIAYLIIYVSRRRLTGRSLLGDRAERSRSVL